MTTSELVKDFKDFLRLFKKSQKAQLEQRVEFVKNAQKPVGQAIHASAEDRYILGLYKEGSQAYNQKKLEIIKKGLTREVEQRVKQNAARYAEEIKLIQNNIASLSVFQNAYQNDGVGIELIEYNSLYVALTMYSHICKKGNKEVAQLLGMALYAGRNSSDFTHKNISGYFTSEGLISPTAVSEDEFELLFKTILNDVISYCNSSDYLKQYMDMVTPESLLNYIKEEIKIARKTRNQLKMEAIQEVVDATFLEYESYKEEFESKKPKVAMEIVKKHYRNKKIISLCNNFEKFKQILDDTNLPEGQKKVIKTAMCIEFEKTFSADVRSVFSWSELMLVKRGEEFLEKSSSDSSEYKLIKELVEQIKIVLDMAETLKVESATESDREYLRDEAKESFKKLMEASLKVTYNLERFLLVKFEHQK